MTVMGAGVTIIEGGMETDERERARRLDGARSAPSPYSPGASSFPRKREPTPPHCDICPLRRPPPFP